MRPPRSDIAAPELPAELPWVGERPARMPLLTARGPVLVHFFDFAQLNSIRALPYVLEWRRRYAGTGLDVLAVHTPRSPFTAERGALTAAVARLGIEHPVADDSRRWLWQAYGCEGWPSLFLWARGGVLAWFHFGEGEYAATEAAIQEELRRAGHGGELPPLMSPLRPTDAPGVLVAAPTEEVFPGGAIDRPFEAGRGSDAVEVEYAAGGAYVSADGAGSIEVALDAGPARSRAVAFPGLYELASHPRHEAHRLALRPSPGVRLWSVSFAAGLPAPQATPRS